MTDTQLPAWLPSAERADDQTLRAQTEKLANLDLLRLLNGFPEGAVILNAHRQIVYVNDQMATFLSSPKGALIGYRLGEVLDCVHARELPGGCGMTESCRYCGGARAIETSKLNRSKEVQECRILRTSQVSCLALDLKVCASPLDLDGERFTLLAIRDISYEKRRELLERIFFHDVMNLVGGLRSIIEQLPDLSGAEAVEFEHLAIHQLEQLVEEIECQRDIAAAELGDLEAQVRLVSVREVLDRLCFLYSHHPVGRGKSLAVEIDPEGATLHADPILLRRALGNLIKNALEASPCGETVTVRYKAGPLGHVFTVHNQAVMDEAVKAQLFQRSFSTKKGKGRGLGSYSVKLLTERYLQGRVEFESVPGEGTTFRITLPGPSSRIPTSETCTTPASLPLVAVDELSGLCILLAEDNPVNRLLVQCVLSKCGMQVRVVPNGKEAVEAAREQSFDAVLMDAEMPEMDGFEATAAIRTRERETGGHLPIIALTGHGSEADRQRCLTAGMDEHLTKPLAKSELLAALMRQIRLRAR